MDGIKCLLLRREGKTCCLNEKVAEMQEQGLIDQYVAEAQTLAGIE